MSFGLNFHGEHDPDGYTVRVNRFTTFTTVQITAKDGDVSLFVRDARAAMDLGQEILKAAAGALALPNEPDYNTHVGTVGGATIPGRKDEATEHAQAGDGADCGVSDNTHCD